MWRAHQFTSWIRWHVQCYGRRLWGINCGGHHLIWGKINQSWFQNEWDGKWVVISQAGGTKPTCILICSPAAILLITYHKNPSSNSAWNAHTTTPPSTKMDRVVYPASPLCKQESQNTKGESRKSNLTTTPIWKNPQCLPTVPSSKVH